MTDMNEDFWERHRLTTENAVLKAFKAHEEEKHDPMDREMSKLHGSFKGVKWAIGLGVPALGGLMAIIKFAF